MTETQTAIDHFLAELRRREVADKSSKSYRSDLALFARWFQLSVGEAFAPEAVTPTDVREYRSHLRTVEGRKPATINRRLAALRKFFSWARATRRIIENPTEEIRRVAATKRAPKSIDKRKVDRLIRAAERSGNKRDLAILQVLRNTGVRVREICSLKSDNLEISERKGALTVRVGKAGKFRQLPLRLTAAMAAGPEFESLTSL